MVQVPAACDALMAPAREHSVTPASNLVGSCWTGAGLVAPRLWAAMTPAEMSAKAPRLARACFNFMGDFLSILRVIADDRDREARVHRLRRRRHHDGAARRNRLEGTIKPQRSVGAKISAGVSSDRSRRKD